MAVAVVSSGYSVAAELAAKILSVLSVIDLDELIKEAIMEHENEITDLNTEQLNQGLRSDGTDTGEYRNINYKGRLRPVDLYDTGAFHKSASVELYKTAFDIVFKDPKTEMLMAKYGDTIAGLTEQNKVVAGEIIKETIVEKLKQKLL